MEALGNNMAGLSNAIERLVLFVESPHTIELDHARECVPVFKNAHGVETWIQLPTETSRGHGAGPPAYGSGKTALQLLALVIRQFRQLLLGFDIRSTGGSLTAAASAASVPSFRQNQFERQLKRYSGNELGRALRRLEKTDLALKSSKMPNALIFEEAVDLTLRARRFLGGEAQEILGECLSLGSPAATLVRRLILRRA